MLGNAGRHSWAEGASGEFEDNGVGMGIVGKVVDYVTMFGPVYNSCKIRPGDKIASVGGVDMDGRSVAFPAAQFWNVTPKMERDAYFVVIATRTHPLVADTTLDNGRLRACPQAYGLERSPTL